MAQSINQTYIAQQVGLSQRAVSKALRGESGVSAKTRERVLAVARECGYRPNRLARALADGTTRVIGMLTPAFSGQYFTGQIFAAQQVLSEQQYGLLLSHWRQSDPTDDHDINVMLQHQVDGILSIPKAAVPWETSIYAELAAQRVNVVCMGQEVALPGLCSVYSDDLSGSRRATEFLLRLGHRHIAYLGPGAPLSTSQNLRRQGYHEAIMAAGLKPCEISTDTGDADDIRTTVLATVIEAPEITALICYNDHEALRAVDALHGMALSVPGDISVVGFGNDLPYPDHMQIPLTTVNQSAEELGRLAAEQLLRMIAGEDVHGSIVVPTELVIRRSTGQPPARPGL